MSLKAPTLDVVLTPDNYLEVADHFGLDVWLSSGGRIYLRIERAGLVIPAFLGDRIIHHYGANAITEVVSRQGAYYAPRRRVLVLHARSQLES